MPRIEQEAIRTYEWRQQDGVIRQAAGRVAWFQLRSTFLGGGVFWTTTDCSSQPYVEQDRFSIMPIGGGTEVEPFYPQGDPNLVVARSAMSGSGDCSELPFGPKEIFASPVDPLETHHFTAPVTVVP